MASQSGQALLLLASNSGSLLADDSAYGEPSLTETWNKASWLKSEDDEQCTHTHLNEDSLGSLKVKFSNMKNGETFLFFSVVFVHVNRIMLKM